MRLFIPIVSGFTFAPQTNTFSYPLLIPLEFLSIYTILPHLKTMFLAIRLKNVKIYLFDLLTVYQLSAHILKDRLMQKRLNTILAVINVAFKKIEGGISGSLIMNMNFLNKNFLNMNFHDMNFQSLLMGIVFLLMRDNYRYYFTQVCNI